MVLPASEDRIDKILGRNDQEVYNSVPVDERDISDIICEIERWLVTENNVVISCVDSDEGHEAFTRPSALWWRHNERDGVSNHERLDCLLSSVFRRSSKKTSKLCVTGLCEGNSPVTGEFPAQRASNVENFSIWWRHHDRIELWDIDIYSNRLPLRMITYMWFIFNNVITRLRQRIWSGLLLPQFRKQCHS